MAFRVICSNVCIYKELIYLKLFFFFFFFFYFFACSEKVGEKLVHVFIINTEETVNRNKIITIDYDFVCFSISSLWQYHYIHHFLVRIYLKTLQLHKDCIFPNQRVNHICYFDLNVVKRQKDRQVLTPYFQIIPFFVNLLDFRTIFGVFHDTVTKH